ncbi:MAG: YbaB/EbfC family nucleoid-associated protein [Treponema sp.]|nr:YbaB/EbfC family nucleoid-associated protein [Treponema sp.]MCL2272582.1 YbaB/EbfC family nucleoid-associated protein [Treponema sp.]
MNINPFDILKNASKIQEQMSGFQEKLGAITSTGASGGGLVEVDINGKLELIAVRIAPEAMTDAEMLQDLIMAAFNDGMSKVRETIAGEVGAMTGGMNFPGMK